MHTTSRRLTQSRVEEVWRRIEYVVNYSYLSFVVFGKHNETDRCVAEHQAKHAEYTRALAGVHHGVPALHNILLIRYIYTYNICN
jgi:hypothetical protein